MSVNALCNRKPMFIKKQAKVSDAARMMKAKNVGSLVVVSGDGMQIPVGMLTDRDIALKAMASGLNGSARVEEIMSKKVVSVPSSLGIAETIDRMEKNGVRRVVVKDAANKICGVVSADDVLQLVAREVSSIGRLVEKQSVARK